MKYYKFLNKDGTTPHGRAAWPMPKRGKPGKWLPKLKGDIVLCRNGYHVITADQLIPWLAPVLWEVEVCGTVVGDLEKYAGRQARLIRQVVAWNEGTMRLFAADCAERVLPLFEKERPNDDRPRKAIEAARAYARGEITTYELQRARDAAGQAAAARDAAGHAWAAARDAGDAARTAGAAAARDAWAAAWDAGAAERQWQTEHLIEMLGIAETLSTQEAISRQ